jgi:fluoroacetyl-CoA thioesterase
MRITEIKIGDDRRYTKIVSALDVAQFESGTVHDVYSTFAITRDAEWCGRLFVLDIKDDNEEGIGTFVEVQHISPAFVGDKVEFTSTYTELTDKAEIITTFTAIVGERVVAKGRTGQRIIDKAKLNSIFAKYTSS